MFGGRSFRAYIREVIETEPYFKVESEEVEEDVTKTIEVEALMRSVIYNLSSISN